MNFFGRKKSEPDLGIPQDDWEEVYGKKKPKETTLPAGKSELKVYGKVQNVGQSQVLKDAQRVRAADEKFREAAKMLEFARNPRNAEEALKVLFNIARGNRTGDLLLYKIIDTCTDIIEAARKNLKV